jgi:hypothetical protein
LRAEVTFCRKVPNLENGQLDDGAAFLCIFVHFNFQGIVELLMKVYVWHMGHLSL